MTNSVQHGSFTVEREFPYPLERVFAAWTSTDAKGPWFAQNDSNFIDETQSFSLDFRIGGMERLEARLRSGSKIVVETRFYDIIPNDRIVATYDVLINGKRISVSLWSLLFQATATGTKLVTVEDGAFLDGLDTAEDRIQGVEWDFDRLADYLERTTAPAAVA